MMKRLVFLFSFLSLLLVPALAQQYSVISITGSVTVEIAGGQKHELQLREMLTPQSKLTIPYKGQVELLNEKEGKKYVLKVPGTGQLGNMLNDRQNTVMQLTGQYLAYIKARLKSNGELTSRRYSDPATVTREVAAKQEGFAEDFYSFRKKANSDYDKFRQDALRTYADFVRKTWEMYGSEPPKERPVEEKVEPVVVKDESILLKPIKSVPLKVEEQVLKLPEIKPQPIPASPIKEQPEENVEYVDFMLYGTPLHVRFNSKEHFTLKEVSENAIADVFLQLASADYNNTIRDCLELRIRHQLSDWGYLCMLDALSKACFSTPNEATLFMAYLYQQSGYQMRMAIKDDRLLMLYSTQHIIYERGYYTLDGANYFVYGPDEDRLRVCKAMYPKEQPLSFIMPQRILLAEERTDDRVLQSKRYPDLQMHVNVNKNLLDFYEKYPTSQIGNDLMTRWAMYANVPLDATIEQTLVADLREKLQGMKELDAMERLLNWVQTAFVYEYDDKVWGGDRAFFAEETLFYPYCDCEDRSILLSRLVRNLLGLKCILVYYPGHLAMAVHFNSDVAGDYIMLGNERYVVTDPTYIGARVGMSMPGCDNQTAQVILLE